jgi:hypothetical protein
MNADKRGCFHLRPSADSIHLSAFRCDSGDFDAQQAIWKARLQKSKIHPLYIRREIEVSASSANARAKGEPRVRQSAR